MEFILSNILTLILFSPLLVVVVLLLLPDDQDDLVRWVSFVLSFIPLVFTIIL